MRDPYQELWRAKLRRMVFDATSKGPSAQVDEMEIKTAKNWFRRADADFQATCWFAGFDPECVLRAWNEGRLTGELLASPCQATKVRISRIAVRTTREITMPVAPWEIAA